MTAPLSARHGRVSRAMLLGLTLAVAATALGFAVVHLRPRDTGADASSKPSGEPAATGPIQLHDVTERTGITFVHTNGNCGRQYIVESMSAGLATFDYDGDGLIDIYFVNGAPLAKDYSGPTPRNALYRNNGDWTFTEVTSQAGVGDTGYGLGATVADYNNDGFPDVYVSNFGPKVLYRNNGDGTFTDVTAASGVADGSRLGAGVCFLDIDRDGALDLYVANYVQDPLDTNPRRSIGGFIRAPSPLDFKPELHTLFRNNAHGTFTDVSEESGIHKHRGTGMGMIAFDCDNDGAGDIFVCNDVAANFLWRNDGHGHFEEVAVQQGVAYDFWGKSHGNMGVDCADFDHDGLLDLFVTSYQIEMPAFFRNLGQGLFEDIAMKSGAGVPCQSHVKWGLGFADFDNDGHPDLYVAQGHLEEQIHLIDDTTAYKIPNIVLRNLGNGQFVDVSKQAGDGMEVSASSRGVCLDDLDNDGRVDVVVLNAQDKPTVLRNASANQHHWLQIRLCGIRCNRDGVGARVQVLAGDLAQLSEVHSGRGYQSHFGSRLHFGLGPRERVDRIEVRWPGGKRDVFQDVAVDQQLLLVEGSAPEPEKKP